KVTLIVGLTLCIGLISSRLIPVKEWNAKSPVADVLFSLDEPKPTHFLEKYSDDDIRRGRELIWLGKTVGPDSSNSGYISKYYVCTSCHNTVREDYDLAVVDQEARLKYAVEHQQAYLQGSTFWGIVN